MLKYCKVQFQMKFLYRDNPDGTHKCFQYFIVADTKYKKYALNNNYFMNTILEDRIKQSALSNIDSNYTFINRKDEEDRVSLEFSYTDPNIKKYSTGYFAIVCDVPYSDGCEECKFNKEMYCTKKDKGIDKILKNCKYFSQSPVKL